MIWQTAIGDRKLWLIEERAHASGRRRVHIAVDTSDSCWPHLQREIEAALMSVSRGLQSQDECCLWMMGREAPSVDTRLADDTEGARVALTRSLFTSLTAERRGTWFRGTADAMITSARASTETINYLLVITDGAVFDAEGVAAPPKELAAAVYRVEQGLSLRPAPSAVREPVSVLAGWTVAPASIPEWLVLERAVVRLELEAGSGGSYRFEPDAQVETVPVYWPQAITGDYARYAILSETAPRLSLVTAREARVWSQTVPAATHATVLEALPRELREVAKRIWGLQLDWRTEVFEALAAGVDTTIACPSCDARYKASEVRSGLRAYCDRCGALVLVHGCARREDPALRHARAVVWDASTNPRIVDSTSVDVGAQEFLIPLERLCY